jgi:hypothetical protein
LPATALEVGELGGDYLPWGTVKVNAMIAPTCLYQRSRRHRGAAVLSRKLVGLAMMQAKLGPSARRRGPRPVGRPLPASTDGIHRIHREGRSKAEPRIHLRVRLDLPGRFRAARPQPEDGEVVGVVSAGVMDDDDQTRDPTTFTRLDAWRSVFVNAQLIADGSSPAEVPPIGGCEGE